MAISFSCFECVQNQVDILFCTGFVSNNAIVMRISDDRPIQGALRRGNIGDIRYSLVHERKSHSSSTFMLLLILCLCFAGLRSRDLETPCTVFPSSHKQIADLPVSGQSQCIPHLALRHSLFLHLFDLRQKFYRELMLPWHNRPLMQCFYLPASGDAASIVRFYGINSLRMYGGPSL